MICLLATVWRRLETERKLPLKRRPCYKPGLEGGTRYRRKISLPSNWSSRPSQWRRPWVRAAAGFITPSATWNRPSSPSHGLRKLRKDTADRAVGRVGSQAGWLARWDGWPRGIAGRVVRVEWIFSAKNFLEWTLLRSLYAEYSITHATELFVNCPGFFGQVITILNRFKRSHTRVKTFSSFKIEFLNAAHTIMNCQALWQAVMILISKSLNPIFMQ